MCTCCSPPSSPPKLHLCTELPRTAPKPFLTRQRVQQLTYSESTATRIKLLEKMQTPYLKRWDDKILREKKAVMCSSRMKLQASRKLKQTSKQAACVVMIFPSFEHAIDGTERGGRGKGARDWNTSGLREKIRTACSTTCVSFSCRVISPKHLLLWLAWKDMEEEEKRKTQKQRREIDETRRSNQISVGKERGIFCPLSLQGNPSRIIIIIYAFRCLAPSCKIGERTGE